MDNGKDTATTDKLDLLEGRLLLKIETVRSELLSEIKDLRTEMLRAIYVTQAGTIAVLGTLVTVLKFFGK
jgi:hypothetical protein